MFGDSFLVFHYTLSKSFAAASEKAQNIVGYSGSYPILNKTNDEYFFVDGTGVECPEIPETLEFLPGVGGIGEPPTLSPLPGITLG